MWGFLFHDLKADQDICDISFREVFYSEDIERAQGRWRPLAWY